MKKLIKYIIILLITATAIHCTKENNTLNSDEAVPVQISMKNTTLFNTKDINLNSVRIIAARQSGLIVYNEKFNNPGQDIKINLYPDNYNIHAIINETNKMSLDTIKVESQLTKVVTETPTCTTPELDIPCYGKITNTKIDKTNTSIQIPTERIHAKLSINVKKTDDYPDDKFTVTNIKLIKIPTYNYLISQTYIDISSIQADIFSGSIEFNSNNINKFVPITENNIIPENILSSTGEETAVVFTINYTPAGSITQIPVTYTIPLNGYDATNNNINRNTHYILNITIKDHTNISFQPMWQIEVANWDTSNNSVIGNDIGSEKYNYNWSWNGDIATGPNGEILVSAGEILEFNFELKSPIGSTWRAHLSNTINFEFITTSGGVTSNTASENITSKIMIAPIGEANASSPTTLFYIEIFNGVTTKRIEFNEKRSFTIKKKPF